MLVVGIFLTAIFAILQCGGWIRGSLLHAVVWLLRNRRLVWWIIWVMYHAAKMCFEEFGWALLGGALMRYSRE
jgi:hypothetical protein